MTLYEPRPPRRPLLLRPIAGAGGFSPLALAAIAVLSAVVVAGGVVLLVELSAFAR